MSFSKIYYSMIWGALGALLGYLASLVVSALVGGLISGNTSLIDGAIRGACVGAGISSLLSYNFARTRGSVVQAVASAISGLVLGGLIASLALIAGELLVTTFPIGFGAAFRTAAWALLGLAIGYAVSRTSGALPRYLMIAGLLGGVIGGGILSLVGGADDTTLVLTTALGIAILGALIGGFIRTAELLMSSAYLERLMPDYGNKKKAMAFMGAQMTYTLDKALTTGQEAVIGSDRKQLSRVGIDIYIDDPSVAGRHAVMQSVDRKYFELRDLAGSTTVNNSSVRGSRRLNHGDTIRIGTVELQFFERRSDAAEKRVATPQTSSASSSSSSGRIQLKPKKRAPTPPPKRR